MSDSERRSEPTVAASARSLLTMLDARDVADRAPLFPSDRLAPRRRRASDIVRLLLGASAFALLGTAASSETDFDARFLAIFSDLPGWIRTIAWFGFTGAGVFVSSLVVVSLFEGGLGRGLFRDLVVSLTITVILTFVGARVATGNWPNLLPEFVATTGGVAYPTPRTAFVVAVALVLGRYVNAQIQQLLRWSVIAMVITPLLLGLTTPTALFGALSVGVVSVAAVRLLFGSPEGLPGVDRLRSTLLGLGVTVDGLAYLPEQPGTVGLARAVASDGRPLDIKVYGVDASGQQRAERVWRSLWYRSAGPSPRGGRSEQAQHEALAVLMARDAGVNVPPIVGVGRAAGGDVLLVSIGASADAISDPSAATLRDAWHELRSLHNDAHITHGDIGPDAIRVVGEGDVELVGLGQASMFPTDQQLAVDIASMLVTGAIVADVDRSIAAAVGVVDHETLEMALPFVQHAVLAPDLRRQRKEAGLDIEALRATLAEAIETPVPELASVKRVKLQNVVIAIAGIIAANALIGQITDVGVDTLADELAAASIAWLVVSFLIKIGSYSTAYIGLQAVVGRPLPFSPTMVLQSAKSFIGLVVPSVVGSVGMNVRFLQNLGVPVIVATTQGPVIGFIGFLAEVSLLLLCAWAMGRELDTDTLTDFDAGGLVLVAVGVVVVGAVTIGLVPALRRRVVPPLVEAVRSVREIVSSPRTLGRIYVSEAMEKLFGAFALAATMAAFGASIPFAALVFVSVGTGLLAGLAPVPGGIGVAEATMAGLLTAVGVPAEQAVSIAIIHRVVTSYLPPVVGFFAFNWLTRQKYI